ncbi:MAG: hypothetical protein B5M52_03130 [Helicobacteraceae bacterium 4484_230]|nr:MAG: hypothetical protein B5M52_03130 [Helicobacteraceae bacterium 4484_230]
MRIRSYFPLFLFFLTISVFFGCGEDDEGGGASSSSSQSSITPDTSRLRAVSDSYAYAYSYLDWDKANFGAYDQLGAGWDSTGGESRAYIKFDFSSVLNTAEIKKAVLRLFYLSNSGDNGVDLGIYNVTSSWLEGGGTYHPGELEKKAAPGELSWTQQPSMGAREAVFNPGAKQLDWIDIDITPMVMKWLNGTQNNGLVIKAEGALSNSVGTSVYRFASKERDVNNDKPKGEFKGPMLILYTIGGSGSSSSLSSAAASSNSQNSDSSLSSSSSSSSTSANNWAGWPLPQWCPAKPEAGLIHMYYYQNSNPDSVTCEYYESGQLHKEWPWFDGLEYGVAKTYHENGVLQEEVPYKFGNVIGVAKQYYTSGQLYMWEPYNENGNHDGIITWYYEGIDQVFQEWSYVDGKRHGMEKVYRKNGQLSEEISYANDKKHGTMRYYYENGQIKYEATWIEDKLDGMRKEYYENGQIESEMFFAAGKVGGLAKGYFESGEVKYRIHYVDGLKHGREEFYFKNGALKSCIIYDRGTKAASCMQ